MSKHMQSKNREVRMLINSGDCYAAKVAQNTNSHNFACNNLECNKLKDFTLILHVQIWEASNQIMYKLGISKNCESASEIFLNM